MRSAIAWFAVWTLSGVALPSAAAPRQAAPTVWSQVSADTLSRRSSHTFLVGDEALVVDPPSTTSEAATFIKTLRRARVQSVVVFITQASPDHFEGFRWIREAFPGARLLAMASTAEAIRDWHVRAGTPAPVVEIPEEFTLTLKRQTWRIIPFAGAATQMTYALWNADSRDLVTGDLVFADLHPALMDPGGRPETWSRALEELSALGPRKVYPGHGAAGGPSLLTKSSDYLKYFQLAAARARSSSELQQTLQARFPRHGLLTNLHQSSVRFAPRKLDAPSDAGPQQAVPPMERGTRIDPPTDLSR